VIILLVVWLQRSAPVPGVPAGLEHLVTMSEIFISEIADNDPDSMKLIYIMNIYSLFNSIFMDQQEWVSSMPFVTGQASSSFLLIRVG
jgi:hypothetical protein